MSHTPLNVTLHATLVRPPNYDPVVELDLNSDGIVIKDYWTMFLAVKGWSGSFHGQTHVGPGHASYLCSSQVPVKEALRLTDDKNALLSRGAGKLAMETLYELKGILILKSGYQFQHFDTYLLVKSAVKVQGTLQKGHIAESIRQPSFELIARIGSRMDCYNKDNIQKETLHVTLMAEWRGLDEYKNAECAQSIGVRVENIGLKEAWALKGKTCRIKGRMEWLDDEFSFSLRPGGWLADSVEEVEG